jgi:hypothetical protein
MRRARIALLAAFAAASWLFPAAPLPAATRLEEPDRDARPAPDHLTAALDARISGKASLDDVRIDASWSRDGRVSSVRVYGNGVVICDGKLQFKVKKSDVVALLVTLRKAHFGAMPEHFGEGEEDEEHEGPRLRGRVSVRAGGIFKSVLQLVDGEQSAELEALARKILETCKGAAQKGTGAESIADGLQKLTTGGLAPEALEIRFQRRVKASGESAGEAWILELEGRRVTDSLMPPGKMPPPARQLVLSDADFQSLTKLLADAGVGQIPINVYTSEYTDLMISLLSRTRFISGRKFLNMTPETQGEKQKAFDRIDEAMRALHDRVEKEGKAVKSAPKQAAASKEKAEKEKEREREREEEREREKENRKPAVTPSSPGKP